MKNYKSAIDEEIEKLEEKIKELKTKKAELEAMPDNERLADAIHSKQCHYAHEDQCGYFYESWKNPGYSRNEYLKKANAMLSEMSLEQALTVIKYL